MKNRLKHDEEKIVERKKSETPAIKVSELLSKLMSYEKFLKL